MIGTPQSNSDQAFNKSSIPPSPIYPIGGVEVSNQPAFKWAPAEGALDYTLQVSASATFDTRLDEVTTDSTSYTSSSTYPANETIYWRVRANDVNTHHPGLNWSAVQTFKRTLPVPQPLASNPFSSTAIPVLGWTAVTGAVGYEEHDEEPNGKTKDFQVGSPAETASLWAGPGIWRWKVRALFPTSLGASCRAPTRTAGHRAHGRTAVRRDRDQIRRSDRDLVEPPGIRQAVRSGDLHQRSVQHHGCEREIDQPDELGTEPRSSQAPGDPLTGT